MPSAPHTTGIPARDARGQFLRMSAITNLPPARDSLGRFVRKIKPLTEFKPFARLPIELRIIIYRLMMEVDRVMVLEVLPQVGPFCNYGPSLASRIPPPIVSLCREARMEALKTYEKRYFMPHELRTSDSPYVYFNKWIDIVVAPQEPVGGNIPYPLRISLALYEPENWEEFHRLAFVMESEFRAMKLDLMVIKETLRGYLKDSSPQYAGLREVLILAKQDNTAYFKHLDDTDSIGKAYHLKLLSIQDTKADDENANPHYAVALRIIAVGRDDVSRNRALNTALEPHPSLRDGTRFLDYAPRKPGFDLQSQDGMILFYPQQLSQNRLHSMGLRDAIKVAKWFDARHLANIDKTQSMWYFALDPIKKNEFKAEMKTLMLNATVRRGGKMVKRFRLEVRGERTKANDGGSGNGGIGPAAA